MCRGWKDISASVRSAMQIESFPFEREGWESEAHIALHDETLLQPLLSSRKERTPFILFRLGEILSLAYSLGMSDLDRYLEAAVRVNTQRSYVAATRHFEVEWGGHLPATADSIARYLADYADHLSINTLKHRLAALAQWHTEHGFVDPTRAPLVRQVLKGIKAVHPAVEKRATPLQLDALGTVADWLDASSDNAHRVEDHIRARRHLRNRALMLLGFWRGMRIDELTWLRIEHVDARPGEGMTAFLPRSKTDRTNEGRLLKVPALSRWCPVNATAAWIAVTERTEGPLFPHIDRWGTLGDAALNVDSIPRILRRVFAQAGLAQAAAYSGHSLRRGFAHWANANGWDVKSLMEYVGWRNVHTAMRYLDAGPLFEKSDLALGRASPATSTVTPPALTAPEPVTANLRVQFSLTSYTQSARRRAKARQLIEEACLARHRAQREDGDGFRFLLRVVDSEGLEEAVATLLDDMYRIADNQGCYLEATISEPNGPRRWE